MKHWKLLAFVVVVILIIAVVAGGSSPKAGTSVQKPNVAQSASAATPEQSQSLGVPTKHSGCAASGGSEDKACTPGAIFSTATKEKICVSGYSTFVRNVPESEKNQAYAEYGITSHTTGQYEVDHLHLPRCGARRTGRGMCYPDLGPLRLST